MQLCVVVVEDEPLIRMDTVAMLEDAGMRVADFDSADEALPYILGHGDEIGAIFTDINLNGEMDGIELATEVFSHCPDIKVVVTSGRFTARPADLPASADFMQKPWRPHHVLQSMHSALTSLS